MAEEFSVVPINVHEVISLCFVILRLQFKLQKMYHTVNMRFIGCTVLRKHLVPLLIYSCIDRKTGNNMFKQKMEIQNIRQKRISMSSNIWYERFYSLAQPEPSQTNFLVI